MKRCAPVPARIRRILPLRMAASVSLAKRRRARVAAALSRGGTALPLWAHRYSTLVEQHPGRAEPVPQHRKERCEKGLCHLHEDLVAVVEKRINPLRFLVAVVCVRTLCATLGCGSCICRSRLVRTSILY